VIAPITVDFLLNEEMAKFVFYLVTVGIPFLFFYYARYKRTKERNFNFRMEKLYLIPVLFICSISLYFGLSNPLVNIIPISESALNSIKVLNNQQPGFIYFVSAIIIGPILEELIFI
jgi:membrane protease YdiL (CAAX protease family)